MWLLRQDVADLLAAKARVFQPTAEQVREFWAHSAGFGVRECEQQRDAADAAEPRSLKVVGDTAEIRVDGVLTPKPDIIAWLFGGGNTTYADLVAAFSRAAAAPEVKRVALLVSSPGGHVNGLVDLLGAIADYQATGKAITVVASQAESAAYAIASFAGKITAVNSASTFGSVGVVRSYFVDEGLVEITNTESPKKRPDPRTDEGKAVIREYLDAVHELVVDAVAKGRAAATGEKVSIATVNESFGQGASFLAGEAKRRGMIDKVATPALRPGKRDDRAQQEEHDNTAPATGAESEPMDLKTLKAQHPDVYDAAVAEGMNAERDRVKAHLNFGEQCGNMKLAVDAISSGIGLTLEVQSRYMTAGMNRAERANRQAETDAAGKAIDGASGGDEQSEAEAKAERLADLVEQKTGTGKYRPQKDQPRA